MRAVLDRARPLLVALVGLAGACAHVEAPRGGPADTTPPSIATSRPSDEAVVPGFDGPVVFVFDERISERGIEEAVSVSPRTSPLQVGHGRDQIRVSLREGWEPDVIYHVTIEPQVRDLFNNPLAERVELVFSTGPAIPATLIAGSVRDRITGRAERAIRVEAIRTDSLVYAAVTDSIGGFRIAQIPEGEYRVRAYRDANNNRALDGTEPRDSAAAVVAADATVDIALSVVAADSTPPTVTSAVVRQGRIEVAFDDYLDPTQELDAAQVEIADPDGDRIEIGRIAIGTLPTDTTAAPPAGPGSQQLPSRTLVVELAADAVLAPEVEYVVTIAGVRNVVGLAGGGETSVTAPAASPPNQ